MRKKLSSCCGRGNVRGSRVGEQCATASRGGGGGVDGNSSRSSSPPERQPGNQQQPLHRMRGAPLCLLRAARRIVSGPGISLASGRSSGGCAGGGGSDGVGAGGCSARCQARPGAPTHRGIKVAHDVPRLLCQRLHGVGVARRDVAGHGARGRALAQAGAAPVADDVALHAGRALDALEDLLNLRLVRRTTGEARAGESRGGVSGLERERTTVRGTGGTHHGCRKRQRNDRRG